jgi:hypothetical protein
MNKLGEKAMTQLILTTAAAILVSLAATPVFAQTVRAPQSLTHDNSGWNGYNNGGYNNTWFDGRNYRSDPMPRGEDIAADPVSSATVRGYK